MVPSLHSSSENLNCKLGLANPLAPLPLSSPLIRVGYKKRVDMGQWGQSPSEQPVPLSLLPPSPARDGAVCDSVRTSSSCSTTTCSGVSYLPPGCYTFWHNIRSARRLVTGEKKWFFGHVVALSASTSSAGLQPT
jgi:hypothetical protein